MSAPPDMREPLPSQPAGTAPGAARPVLPGTRIAVPPDVQRWGQRFGAGAHMLWHLFGVLRSQPRAWRRYLQVCILQAVVTLALAVVVVDKSGLTDLVEEAPPPPPPLPRIVAPLGPVAVGAPTFQPRTVAEDAEDAAPLAEDDAGEEAAAEDAAGALEEQLAEAAQSGDEARMKQLTKQLISQAMRKSLGKRGVTAPVPPAAPVERSGAAPVTDPGAPPAEGTATAPAEGRPSAPAEGKASAPEEAAAEEVAAATPEARTPEARTPPVSLVPPAPPMPPAPWDDVPSPAARPEQAARKGADAEHLASLARTQAVLQQLQLRLEAKDPEGARAAAAQLKAALASMRVDARAVKAEDAVRDLEAAARQARSLERALGRDAEAGALTAAARLENVGERVVRAGGRIDEAEQGLHQKAQASRWRRALALLASLYATLFTMQYVVLALSREYHDSITRQLSLAVGLEPEDPDVKPRIHLNLRWVRTKMVRRVRSFIAFLPGLILAGVASTIASVALAWTFPIFKRGAGAVVSQGLTFVWAAYWWTVFTAGKSARAWTEEGRAPAPAFLRRLEELTQTSPVFRWWGPRLFCRMALACSRSFYSPAAAVDRQPLEFAGLAAVRALALVPLFKLFIRPLAPVASAQLLAAQGLTFPTARPARDETARDARGD